MDNSVISILANFIAKEIIKQPNRTISPEQTLISSGLIDSFSLVDLALFIEDTFGVHVDDTELNAETFDNLVELSELIRTRRS